MNISLCRARGVYKYIQQVLKCYYIRRATVVCVVTILMPRTAFIVGASRGIGKGLVDVFSKAGWSVHATVRNLDNISFPDNVVTHILDVEKEEQIREVANSSKLHNVSIDLFIHNAGVKPSSSIYTDTNPASIYRSIVTSNMKTCIKYKKLLQDIYDLNNKNIVI